MKAATLLPIASLLATASAGLAADPPTFSEDVAPIIYAHCAECHRAGEPAPFPLTTYAEVRRRGQMIADVTGDGFMPPWHPAPDIIPFQHERRLSEEQIDTLAAWYEAKMPEGDPSLAPALPDFPQGWRLGEPDLVLEMPEGFTVPPDGPDIYRSFVVPIQLPEDKWVRAVEVRAGGDGVLHHTLLFLDGSGEAVAKDGKDGRGPGFRNMDRGDAGSLGGWAVGAGPKEFPDGLAIKLPAHTDLILSSHLHPTGKEAVEATKVGLFFADAPPENLMVGFQVPRSFGAASRINIPPGESEYTVTDSLEIPVDVDLIQVGGHMHYIGKWCSATALLPDGTEKPLFEIPHWDFNWQDSYLFAEPVPLPAGTKVEVTMAWDNSAENPFNPHDPPERVKWGKESTDEMGSISFIAVAKNPEHAPILAAALRRNSSTLSGSSLGDGGVAQAVHEGVGIALIKRLDTNGNLQIELDELPEEMADPETIAAVDANEDGVITFAEFAAAREALAELRRKQRRR